MGNQHQGSIQRGALLGRFRIVDEALTWANCSALNNRNCPGYRQRQ